MERIDPGASMKESSGTKMHVKELRDPEMLLKEPIYPNMDPEILSILQFYNTYPLHKSAKCGHYENLSKLLEYGFPPDATDFDCFTPLHEACNHGQLKCAELLIKHGAKVNVMSIDGATPLCDACSSGSTECVRLLLSHGALVNPPLVLTSPLHEACLRGSLDCVSILISSGARLNSNDCRHGTPLHAATANNHPGCIRLLLQAGAPVDDPIIHQTALHIAAMNSYYEAGCVLLEFGANVNASNNQNKTPIKLLQEPHGPLYDALLRYTVVPPNLEDLCRRKIRSIFGTMCSSLIPKLPLPQPICSYLMHTPIRMKKIA